MQLLTFGNDLLCQKAEPVKNLNGGPSSPPWNVFSWNEIFQKMLDIIKQESGIGLAGPQIALMERVFVVNTGEDVPRIFINPSIIETSEEAAKYEEGCLSVPKIWANVIRPKKVKVQAWNEKGRPFTLEAEGMLARVILHEYDHLEGVLFLDRLPESKRKRLLDKLAKRAKA